MRKMNPVAQQANNLASKRVPPHTSGPGPEKKADMAGAFKGKPGTGASANPLTVAKSVLC